MRRRPLSEWVPPWANAKAHLGVFLALLILPVLYSLASYLPMLSLALSQVHVYGQPDVVDPGLRSTSTTSDVKPSDSRREASPRAVKPATKATLTTMTTMQALIRRMLRARARRADAATCEVSVCLAMAVQPVTP